MRPSVRAWCPPWDEQSWHGQLGTFASLAAWEPSWRTQCRPLLDTTRPRCLKRWRNHQSARFSKKVFYRSKVASLYSEMCRKMGSLPSLGLMKPCPFWRQKFWTVPRNTGPEAIRSDLEKWDQIVLEVERSRLNQERLLTRKLFGFGGDAASSSIASSGRGCHGYRH